MTDYNVTVSLGGVGATSGVGVYNVLDYGATGNGVTDDTEAIQSALDACANAGGGEIVLPRGTYITSSALTPRSNMYIHGQGKGTRIESSAIQAIILSRDAAVDEDTPHTNVKLSDMYVQSAWGGETPQHSYSCITFEFCNDCIIDGVIVGRADDACIRVSGYRKGLETQLSSLDNPGFGYAKRNVVRNCTLSGGYLGIELVGGCQCDLDGNTILDAVTHGIRMAGGGWYSSVTGNRVMDCSHSAMYVQHVKNSNISNNPYFNSTREGTPTAYSQLQSEDITVSGNVFVGIVTDTILSTGLGGDESSRVTISDNIIDGDAKFDFTFLINFHDNYVSGTSRLRVNTTGKMTNNIVGYLSSTAGETLCEGGSIYYSGNIDKDTYKIAVDNQSMILGSHTAAPTSGTFVVGEIVFNSAPASIPGNLGWVCTSSGSPGTWSAFGYGAQYYGAGSPEGAITASPGSIYLNRSGGAGTSLYVKESGTGNTGWVAK